MARMTPITSEAAPLGTTTTTLSTAASPVSVVATPLQEPIPDCFSLHDDDVDSAVIKTHVIDSSPDTGAISWESFICPASAKSQRTTNPIRAIVDPIMSNVQSGYERGDGKDHISLALGDPTAHGNLEPCPLAIEAIVQAVQSPPHAASYINACGTMEARLAIAQYHHTTNPDHVIVANGCSGALELALTALLDPDTYVLVPQPGFPLYQVIAESHGARVLPYRLDPLHHWQVDLDDLEEQIQSVIQSRQQQQQQQSEEAVIPPLIRAMVVNNPSNPTGCVYSKEHLQDILRLCQRFGIPIVADEVYGDLVLDPVTTPFWPMATLAQPYQVPVITASGLAKQFLLPGWRIGWIVFHDNCYGSLASVMAGAKRLAQLILGASHLAQAVIPALLSPSSLEQQTTLQKWKLNLQQTLARQAQFLCQELAFCPGLQVVHPQGAMYAMIRIIPQEYSSSLAALSNSLPHCPPKVLEPSITTTLAPLTSSSTSQRSCRSNNGHHPNHANGNINNNDTPWTDVQFCKLLLEEENVLVLPGSAFGASPAESNLVRVVFCAPEPIMREAIVRIKCFCQRHFFITD